MFKPEFAPLVESGAKRQTIRPLPKRLPRPGDRESWREWLGKPYRSPQRELARVKIVSVERIKMEQSSHEFLISLLDRPLRGALLPIDDWNDFAKADGFKSMFEMVLWFEREHGLPFTGIIIKSQNL
ncbi:MAG: ASCH domain-containing protein [Patescibacteria group bacterium]|nr:ASCH domain-containing protein [Patescibacteria group bacterium]